MALRRGRRGREDGDFPGFADVVEIGTGGFSTVYRALEVATDRPVALKLLRVGSQVAPHALESFRRETLALGALSDHPHIVTLYRSFTTASGRPVLVLELCRGSMATRLAAEGAIPAEEAVSVAIRIAGALTSAHEVGMLHRDVKPQNVLLTSYGEPALADFGVARLQASAERGGALGFTTCHAPPELLEGGTASAATDVYELASTLYQLVAGRPAFQVFEDEDPASAALRILRDPVPPLSRAGVPVALSDLLGAAMAKAPAERPPSARAFAAALQSIAAAAGWAPTRAVTREGGSRAPSGSGPPAAAPAATPTAAGPRPRGLAPAPAPAPGGSAGTEAPTGPSGSAGHDPQRAGRRPASVPRPASLVAPTPGRRRVLTPSPAPPGRPAAPAPSAPAPVTAAPATAAPVPPAPVSASPAPAPTAGPVAPVAPAAGRPGHAEDGAAFGYEAPPARRLVEETVRRLGGRPAEAPEEDAPAAPRRGVGRFRRRREPPPS